MAINELALFWGQGKINSALIIAPNGVHTNWHIREITAHMPEWVRYISAAWDTEKTRRTDPELNALFEVTDSTMLRIFCTSWDAMSHQRGQQMIEKFCLTSSKLLIIADESHNAANPSSIRSKFLHKIKKYSTARRIMSGTFMHNSPFDLFSQFSFLSENILETTSYYAFKNEYCEMLEKDNRVIKKVIANIEAKTGKPYNRTPQIPAKDGIGNPRYKNIDKLHQLIAPHQFRVLKAECLDLPKKIYTQSFFELTSVQKEAYKKMREECRAVLEDGSVTAFNKLAALAKLPQIAANFLIDTETKKVQIIDKARNPKLELMKSRLQEVAQYGDSTIVFSKFKYEILQLRQLCEEMDLTIVEYHGDVKQADREIAIDSFQAKNAQIFLAQTKAAYTGLTLTAARRVFYYSNLFSLGVRLQSEDRAHRIGQFQDVLYEDIIGRGTIDEFIVSSLRLKKNIFNIITGDNYRI
jgi:SNF2 family DNA or RNA helicase